MVMASGNAAMIVFNSIHDVARFNSMEKIAHYIKR